jgi:hypothetical protein
VFSGSLRMEPVRVCERTARGRRFS